MSYDLAVYLPRRPSSGELRAIVVALPGLSVEHASETGVTVVRGIRRAYSFTVDGPDHIEPEDVPESVTARVLGASFLFSVRIEGSDQREVQHAVRFARRLAKDFDGAVVDDQRGELWARGTTRRVPAPTSRERVDVIKLSWWVSSENVPDDAAERYLSRCRQILPEALPRRFGESEPLPHKLANAGDTGFAEMWRAASGTMFFSAEGPPCVEGHMWAGPGKVRPGPVWKMGLTLLREPLCDPSWRDATRRLFVQLAANLNAFFAYGEVVRRYIWDKRSIFTDEETESAARVATTREWNGPPPYPVWWSWYGPIYRESVGPHLRNPVLVGDALFHAWTEEPADRGELRDLSERTSSAARGPRGWSPPNIQPVI